MRIDVAKTLGTALCMAASEGQKIYEMIAQAYDNHEDVTLDFSGVKQLSPTFLNNAVGQLFRGGGYPHFETEGLTDYNASLLIRVLGNAKDYFENLNKGVNNG